MKSCVGSTWCRYGVGDSVGLAVELGEPLQGLRAPHKIKFGVSGCTRECAEAQSKDIGIIATDKGWNLYVCGNGGMKPRHAELLASDLTKEKLVQLIDRFLMFYVHRRPPAAHQHLARQPGRRRPRLPEGRGDERQPGLAAGLEAQMQHVVDTYQCGWKTAVTNPTCASASAPSSIATRPTSTSSSSRSAARSARPPDERPPTDSANRRGHHRLRSPAMSIEPLVWTTVCAVDDIPPNTGVCALAERPPVAVFRVGDNAVLRHRQRGPEIRRQRAVAGPGRATWRSRRGRLAALQEPLRPRAHRRLPAGALADL